MRLLFLNHHPSLYGATRSLVDLVTGLRSFGVESKIVSPFDGPVVALARSHGVEHEVIPFEWSMASRPNRLGGRVRRTLSNVRSFSRLSRAAHQWKPDVVYTNSSVLSVGRLLAKRMGLPHVWHIREMGRPDFDLYHDYGLAVFRMLLRTSSALVANSKAVRDHVCPSDIRERVHVIYNGIAPRKRFDELLCARKMSPPDGPNFLMVGAVIPAKGQTEAIQALALVRKQAPGATLRILGGGDETYVARIQTLCNQLGLAGHVELLGEARDPFPYYAKACALLVCSTAEAMGRVTVEAMASGCPVIGRACGATPELIDDGQTGLLYQGGPDALAHSMMTLINSPEEGMRLATQAWPLARERFSIEAYSRAVFDVLSRVRSN
jgi:glycosyltransferase involved in cell wall biosynthesis